MRTPKGPLGEMLSFDPLAAAEQLTGESYKDDQGTMALGMLLSVDASDRKQVALQANRDTYYSMSWEEALAVFADLGIGVVHTQPVAAFDGSPQAYVVGWSDDGLLLTADSYHSRINSAKVHYNWLAHDGVPPFDFISSGRVHGQVLVGDHSVVEGARYHVERMRANGRFLNPWQQRPFLWLNPADEKDWESATARVIASLPAHVRAGITPEVKS